jgi:methylenetetrahydrofolate--tRNA-(uracil-5-)-methyltransferase
MKTLTIIGGGLAGSEAAWQAAMLGVPVVLFEMRPVKTTGAHTGSNLAELVCSNSLGSNLPDRASGLLKNELRRLGSLLVRIAENTALPAGSALAVDREEFAQQVTRAIESHPLIQIRREEVLEIPAGPAIIASGPLTSEALTKNIQKLTNEEHLAFYDAIAPVIVADSIDLSIAFRASRYGKGEDSAGDYINCPFTREEYGRFYAALVEAERIGLRDFEAEIDQGIDGGIYFEGCLPVEVLARRGSTALTFGPMRPVGLHNPHTGERPYAVLQLRQDNLAGSLYNMVGFQTNLTYPEQKRVFRMIPGLEKAEFARLGQMHRNTFIASPCLLEPTLQFKGRKDLFFAGQIAGVEGYMGNIATGLLAGINAARLVSGKDCLVLPNSTMLGSLCRYITQAQLVDFQPMKANFGILPSLETPKRLSKRDRYAAYAERALNDLEIYLEAEGESIH